MLLGYATIPSRKGFLDLVALRRQKSVRERVAERAGFRCEYCRSPESHSLSTFAVEHIEPSAEGGADEEANLAYACSGCNGYKAVAQTGVDPETQEVAPLFHPRRDLWEVHFSWDAEGITLVGITPTGRATVVRLRLNRAGVVNLRSLLIEKGLHP
jgi:HNH endonuclease